MKKVILIMAVPILVACGEATQKAKTKPDYSLLDEIYKKPEVKLKRLVNHIVERRGKVLKSPKYIKVYRGSYKDSKGNVVDGGYEWIKVDEGQPDTNF